MKDSKQRLESSPKAKETKGVCKLNQDTLEKFPEIRKQLTKWLHSLTSFSEKIMTYYMWIFLHMYF